jgi:hypothetical protein
VGRRKKNDIAALERDVIGGRKGEIGNAGVAPKVREQPGNDDARFGSRCNGGEFDLGMLRQKAQQFDTGITRATNNSGSNHKTPDLCDLDCPGSECCGQPDRALARRN